MRTLLLVAVLTAFAISGPVLAQELDGTWRPPPVGMKVAYSTGTQYEVIGVDGGTVLVKGDRHLEFQNASWTMYKAFCNSISIYGDEATCDEDAVDALFPLEVGKKVTANWRASQWRGKTTYKVSSTKTIETVIGPRQVFGLVYRTEARTQGNQFKSKGFEYYDPALGIVISGRDIGVSASYKIDWKLVSLELPE